MARIELIGSAGVATNRGALAELLIDAVSAGASVGFLAPLSKPTALDYWREVESGVRAGSRLVLAAWEDGALAGAVQLALAGQSNGTHRAEVAKLMVHSSFRRAGFARALMRAVEDEARRRHRTLLVLDTRRGDAAESLYRKLGYCQAGTIPAYARCSAGSLDSTVIFYKILL